MSSCECQKQECRECRLDILREKMAEIYHDEISLWIFTVHRVSSKIAGGYFISSKDMEKWLEDILIKYKDLPEDIKQQKQERSEKFLKVIDDFK